jgi:lipopolysaccharide transport system permease protein
VLPNSRVGSSEELAESLSPAIPAELRVVVYAPGSALRTPRALLSGMAADLLASRELAWRLFVRNTKARYRQTLLGYFWAFAPPLVTAAVFLFLRRSGVFAVGETAVPYSVFLFTGLVLWQTFVDALASPLRMVNHSRDMLSKINFPREALVLAGLAEVLFNFLVRGVLLAAVLLWFRVALAPSALLFPLGLLALIGVGLALGLLLVPIGILYQDVEQALGAAVALWFFVTPVIYPAPRDYPASLTMTLNPASAVLDTARAWLLGAPPLYVAGTVAIGAGTLVVLLVGWLLYRLALPILIERMSA